MMEGGYSLCRLGAGDFEPALRLDALFGTAFDERDTYEDAPAVALYEKMGRREEVLHFDIEVKRPER